MNTESIDFFNDLPKAMDHAMWLNFKYRIAKIKFGVIELPNTYEAKLGVVEEATAQEMNLSFIDVMPKDYAELNYNDLRHIRMDNEPLPHWEKLIGMISTADGEVLRYVLHNKIPLEKLIRFELASRGYDENHRWCGFDKAADIWLK